MLSAIFCAMSMLVLQAQGKLVVDMNGLKAVFKQLDIAVIDQQVSVLFEAMDKNNDGLSPLPITCQHGAVLTCWCIAGDRPSPCLGFLDFDEFGSKFFTSQNMLEHDAVAAVHAMKKDAEDAKVAKAPENPEEKMRQKGTRVLKKIVGILLRNAKKAKPEMENAFARFKKPIGNVEALDKLGFRAAIRQMGIMIWVDEADALFNVLDVNDDNCVDSEEFFVGLLKPANAIFERYDEAKVSGAAEAFGLAAQEITKHASQDAKALHRSLMKWLSANGSTADEGFQNFLRKARAEHVLTQPEFKRGIKACGIAVGVLNIIWPCDCSASYIKLYTQATEAAAQELFALLDPNHDLSLDQGEFYDGFYSLDDQKLAVRRRHRWISLCLGCCSTTSHLLPRRTQESGMMRGPTSEPDTHRKLPSPESNDWLRNNTSTRPQIWWL